MRLCGSCGAVISSELHVNLKDENVYAEFWEDGSAKADYFCNDECVANFFYARALRGLDARG